MQQDLHKLDPAWSFLTLLELNCPSMQKELLWGLQALLGSRRGSIKSWGDSISGGKVVEELVEVLRFQSRTCLRYWMPCLRKAGSELSINLVL